MTRNSIYTQAIGAAWLAVLLTCCTADGTQTDGYPLPEGDDVRAPLQVSAAAPGMTVQGTTRAVNDTWRFGDPIGVFAYDANTGELPIDAINALYTSSYEGSTDDGTTFIEFTAVNTPIYLSRGATAVFAYYPYTTNANSVTMSNPVVPVNVSVQTNQEAIDWMSTGPTYNTMQGGSVLISSANPSVELLFNHRLTKLQFNLLHGTGMETADLLENTVRLDIAADNGFYTTGLFNIYDGSVSGMDNQGPITPLLITPTPTTACAFSSSITAPAERAFEAIVLPQAMTTGPEVTITIGNTNNSQVGTYYFTLPAPAGGAFKAGYRYIYNVLVDATIVTVTNTVTPWVHQNEDHSIVY